MLGFESDPLTSIDSRSEKLRGVAAPKMAAARRAKDLMRKRDDPIFEEPTLDWRSFPSQHEGTRLASILILNMGSKGDVALRGDNPDNAAYENAA
jgi:hypothetical protein